QRAKNPIDLKEGEFVTSAAITLLVAASHVHLGVFMNDPAIRRDNVGNIQVTVRGPAQGAGDNPNLRLTRGLAGAFESGLHRLRILFYDFREIITREIGLGE